MLVLQLARTGSRAASHRRRTSAVTSASTRANHSPEYGTVKPIDSSGHRKQPRRQHSMAGPEDVQEPAFDPQIKDLAGWAWKGIYWIFWPIGISLYYLVYYISFAAGFVLKLVYRPLEFILLPVFYLLQFVLNCLLAPFQFLAKFEVHILHSRRSSICSPPTRLSTST